MWRKPPTAILWIATATLSSARSTTGSVVISCADGHAVELAPSSFMHQVALGEDAAARAPLSATTGSRRRRLHLAHGVGRRRRRARSSSAVRVHLRQRHVDAARLERGSRATGCRRCAGRRRSSRTRRRPGCSRSRRRGRSSSAAAVAARLDRPGLAADAAASPGRPRPELRRWRRRSGRRPAGRASAARRAAARRPAPGTRATTCATACRRGRVLGLLVVDEQVGLGDAVLAELTTSGCRPLRRMPLSRSLPKIIGLPCSRTSIRSSRTSRSVKSR